MELEHGGGRVRSKGIHASRIESFGKIPNPLMVRVVGF